MKSNLQRCNKGVTHAILGRVLSQAADTGNKEIRQLLLCLSATLNAFGFFLCSNMEKLSYLDLEQ